MWASRSLCRDFVGLPAEHVRGQAQITEPHRGTPQNKSNFLLTFPRPSTSKSRRPQFSHSAFAISDCSRAQDARHCNHCRRERRADSDRKGWFCGGLTESLPKPKSNSLDRADRKVCGTNQRRSGSKVVDELPSGSQGVKALRAPGRCGLLRKTVSHGGTAANPEIVCTCSFGRRCIPQPRA